MLPSVRTPARTALCRGVSRFLRLVAADQDSPPVSLLGLPHGKMKCGVLFRAPLSVTTLVVARYCMGR